jgi:hypothetical protein
LQRLLDPQQSPFTPQERAILRTKLNLPAETPGAAPATNAVPGSVEAGPPAGATVTNAPASR